MDHCIHPNTWDCITKVGNQARVLPPPPPPQPFRIARLGPHAGSWTVLSRLNTARPPRLPRHRLLGVSCIATCRGTTLLCLHLVDPRAAKHRRPALPRQIGAAQPTTCHHQEGQTESSLLGNLCTPGPEKEERKRKYAGSYARCTSDSPDPSPL